MMSLVARKVTMGRRPLVVVLNVTSRCNLRCGYCYGRYYDRMQADISTDDILALIDRLGEMGTCSITLGGGEPLMREDIGRIIERVKANGIECGFNTNGILVSKRLKELKRADMICVSLDGPRELNDLNRGTGSYDRIMKGIDVALDNGLKVHTTTVVTRHNLEAIDWIVETAEKKGMKAEFNFLFHQSAERQEGDGYTAEHEALKRAATRIADLCAEGAPILFSESVYRLVADWPDLGERLYLGRTPEFRHIPCSAGRFMMFIDADGRVFPCVQLREIFQGRDFRKGGIEKAWENCAHHACKACYFPCFNELNKIMALDFRTIMSQMTKTLKGI